MNKVRVHTVEQPESDITTFVLSCDRLYLLERTIETFLKTKNYVTKLVMVDDSGKPEIFDQLVNAYGHIFDIICFPENRSQWWAMDFMVSYCDTKYIFYVEDDWEFLKSDYLSISKNILEKYRDIGVIDISFRTFEWQGIDSYHKELIDDTFYYKKPWKITENHLPWWTWCGGPNLKRRDDLILLGRIEKWYNEWNIDRKFMSLGFKGVFLKEAYVRHTGDHDSRMKDKRPDDSKTPEHYYPKELLANRTYPYLDYSYLDLNFNSLLYRDMDMSNKVDVVVKSKQRESDNIVLVTGLADINRTDRNFFDHYVTSLYKLTESDYPMTIYTEKNFDSEYLEKIKEIRKDKITVYNSSEYSTVFSESNIDALKEIITSEKFINQSEWIRNSALTNPKYILLTLYKLYLLRISIAEEEDTPEDTKYFWVDAGMFSSYNIKNNINEYDFSKIPTNKFFMTTYAYNTNSEIHGYNINYMTGLCRTKPNYVCRATVFGGTKKYIEAVNDKFNTLVRKSLNDGYIGTEEAIFTALSYMYPELFTIHVYSGDINYFLNTLKGDE
mgnify:CR=1 FL=1